MEQNFQTTKAAGAGANVGPGYPPNASWSDTSNITTDDSNYAWIGFFEGGQGGDTLVASSFGLSFPPGAVIDGVGVNIVGMQSGCYGSVGISASGASSKDIGALNQVYGGSDDLWGASSIDPADLESLTVSVDTSDVSGADGIAYVYYVEVTVYWHIEIPNTPADVPTRVAYKVYSRAGNYLGELPKVTTDLAFPQDINTAGATLSVTCGKYINNPVTTEALQTEAGDPILTESNLSILATSTDLQITTGDSADEAIFKNSNRVKVWLYNQYYPNGKLMFSGQMKRVRFKYGGGDATVSMMLYSDGVDLNNYIARGYPFSYTNDQSQTSQNGYVTSQVYTSGGWDVYGQSWRSGAAVSNIGAIRLMLQGSATVTLSIYDAPNGNLIGNITKTVSNGTAAVVDFELQSLVGISPSTDYFFVVWVNAGQSIRIYRQSTNVYANGSIYVSNYSGGSGGGSFSATTGDLYFITKSGTPTTTTTYSTQDPVTGMAHGILLDYNARGGIITEGDFDATGLSLTYTFVVAFVLDAINKIIELSPNGTYYYVDLGTSQIDIKQPSSTPDFTVVRGRHINELDIDLSIENVKNYLLLSCGDTGGGSNLYRDYSDNLSQAYYDIQTATKSDNRITLAATADAVGDSFIEENASEQQFTSLTVLNEQIDITLLTPGKTIGFKNFGNFIDDLVLQIVRREPNFNKGTSTLTLGRLPLRLSDEIQRINRELLNEQTINNPSSPS